MRSYYKVLLFETIIIFRFYFVKPKRMRVNLYAGDKIMDSTTVNMLQFTFKGLWSFFKTEIHTKNLDFTKYYT